MLNRQLSKGRCDAVNESHAYHKKRAPLFPDSEERGKKPLSCLTYIQGITSKGNHCYTNYAKNRYSFSQDQIGNNYEKNRSEGKKRYGEAQGRCFQGLNVKDSGRHFKGQCSQECQEKYAIDQWYRDECKSDNEKGESPEKPEPGNQIFVVNGKRFLGEGVI